MCKWFGTVSSNTRPFVTNFGLPAKSGQTSRCYPGRSVTDALLKKDVWSSELIVSPHYETIGGDVLSSILTQYKDTTALLHTTRSDMATPSLNACLYARNLD